MPALKDHKTAQTLLLPWLSRFADRSLKPQGMLRSGAPLRDIRVDDLQRPRAALLRQGTFFSLYAETTRDAEDLLEENGFEWRSPQGFAGVPEVLLESIASQTEIVWRQPCYQFYLPKDASAMPMQRYVQGVTALNPLVSRHVDQVLTHWPYGERDNLDDQRFIARRIATGLNAGFYDGDELVSWALTGDDLSMGMMHTLESHRRQGIAAMVSSQLVLTLREAQITPYCYVVEGNAPPLRLLAQLGFVQSEGRYFWLGTQPRTAAG